MPVTITLENIPDTVHERLKASAALHRRSLGDEAIACLESALAPVKVSPAKRLERARVLRARLRNVSFPADDIVQLKRQGRP